MNEYFKITETLKLIEITKQEDAQETITKNRISHLFKNVNLMRESANFERERILKILEKTKTKDLWGHKIINADWDGLKKEIKK